MLGMITESFPSIPRALRSFSDCPICCMSRFPSSSTAVSVELTHTKRRQGRLLTQEESSIVFVHDRRCLLAEDRVQVKSELESLFADFSSK